MHTGRPDEPTSLNQQLKSIPGGNVYIASGCSSALTLTKVHDPQRTGYGIPALVPSPRGLAVNDWREIEVLALLDQECCRN